MSETVLGIIGGSGLSDIAGLEGKVWKQVSSPFGEPSDALCVATLQGLPVVFLPRHGRGHNVSPDSINYRANIDAFKRMGVTDIVSFSACGSLREDLPPGAFMRVAQYIDRTRSRVSSFFGKGLVAHVSMADPVCGRLGEEIDVAAAELAIELRKGGTYLAMEGPQFSTKAESELYRSWGCDVIGMTNMPEAKLAREAEICYASISMITDYDCWHPDHGHVEVADIIQVLGDNAGKAASLVDGIARQLSTRRDLCTQGCDRVLDTAIITGDVARDPDMVSRLDAIAGRVLGDTNG